MISRRKRQEDLAGVQSIFFVCDCAIHPQLPRWIIQDSHGKVFRLMRSFLKGSVFGGPFFGLNLCILKRLDASCPAVEQANDWARRLAGQIVTICLDRQIFVGSFIAESRLDAGGEERNIFAVPPSVINNRRAGATNQKHDAGPPRRLYSSGMS